MNEDMKILQLFYSAALSDAAFHYGTHGVFDTVTEDKKQNQRLMAAGQLQQLDIENIETVYLRFAEIFGCADWQLTNEGNHLIAESQRCTLCAIAKRQGSPQPCAPFCINPFASFAEAFGYRLEVDETLWDGEKCRFINRRTREDHEIGPGADFSPSFAGNLLLGEMRRDKAE